MQQVPITRRGVPPQWTAPSLAYGLRGSAAVVLPLLILLALAPVLWAGSSILAAVVLLPLVGVQIYKLTIVMHDCTHASLFPSRRMNRVVGLACGALLATDFDAFTRSHWKHHRSYGMPDDPQGDDYLGLRAASRSKLLWHLVRPLVGANLVKLIRFADEADRPDRTTRASTLGRLAVVAVVQLALAVIATGGGAEPVLIGLYPAAGATFALFFSQLRGFAEHVAPPSSPSEAHVRTHLPRTLDHALLYCLNFNFHLEHHLYPDVPSCHLPEVYAAEGDRWHDADTLSSNMWATIRRRVAQAS